MWELDCEESWAQKNWCFWTVVLEKTLESPLDYKEIQPVHSEGDQPWDFFGGNDGAKAETPVLWPPHAKSWLIGKDSDAGRDWGQEEKGTTEDEMAGLNGHEFGWTPGVGDGQGGLACCSSWGGKEPDMTERLNWTDWIDDKIEGREGDDKERDGWMTSATQWTWVWANSGRWWRTEKPGVLQSVGLQRVGHNLVIEQQCHLLQVSVRLMVMESLCSEIEAYLLGSVELAWEVYWWRYHWSGRWAAIFWQNQLPGFATQVSYTLTSFSLTLCFFCLKRHWACCLTNKKCLWNIWFVYSHTQILNASPV